METPKKCVFMGVNGQTELMPDSGRRWWPAPEDESKQPRSAASVAMNMALREAFTEESEVGRAVRQVMGVYPVNFEDAYFKGADIPPLSQRLLPGTDGEPWLVFSARHFAHIAHCGQRRKYTNAPYITHPYCVANIVRCVPHDDAMLAAAWLHDVVEDCGVKIEEVCKLFGDDVAGMVAKLSDISTKQDGNREMRKKIDREWTATGDARVQTVKLADLIDNSHSIMQYDPQFAVNYLTEKRLLLNVLDKGDRDLWAIADRICSEAGF